MSDPGLSTSLRTSSENGKNVSENGKNVSENGENVSENGENVSENGENVSENGENVSGNGKNVSGNGENVSRNGENDNGTVKTREQFLTNPRHNIVFHYTPKHASWMNQIEIWFGILKSKVIRRGSFNSIGDLKQKIMDFIKYYNESMAQPFKWTYCGQVLDGH